LRELTRICFSLAQIREIRGFKLPQWEAAWKPVLEPPPADLKMSPKNPASLPEEAEIQPAGGSKIMTLLPYGATHLRLTTLPVIKVWKSARQ